MVPREKPMQLGALSVVHPDHVRSPSPRVTPTSASRAGGTRCDLMECGLTAQESLTRRPSVGPSVRMREHVLARKGACSYAPPFRLPQCPAGLCRRGHFWGGGGVNPPDRDTKCRNARQAFDAGGSVGVSAYVWLRVCAEYASALLLFFIDVSNKQ